MFVKKISMRLPTEDHLIENALYAPDPLLSPQQQCRDWAEYWFENQCDPPHYLRHHLPLLGFFQLVQVSSFIPYFQFPEHNITAGELASLLVKYVQNLTAEQELGWDNLNAINLAVRKMLRQRGIFFRVARPNIRQIARSEYKTPHKVEPSKSAQRVNAIIARGQYSFNPETQKRK